LIKLNCGIITNASQGLRKRALFGEETVKFRNSSNLSGSEEDMNKFHDIRAVLRELILEHFDVKVQWRKQPKDAKEAFEKAVSLHHSAFFIFTSNNVLVQ
jgi:hypothetical protein